MWAAAGGWLFLSALAAAPPPGPGSLTLAWDPSPGTNVIRNYAVYWGPAAGTYTNHTDAALALTLTVTNLVRGPAYYFAATATDTNGLESIFSNETFTNIPTPPPPPSNLRIRPTP